MKIILFTKAVLILTLLTGFRTISFSQSCSGSLGESIFSETFGNTVGTPLSSGKTSYTFISDRCPTDGEYILANSTQCYGSTWHSISEDHTPNDVNGVMMVVNASYDSGEFYSQTVSGLCKGITYEFSVWVLNLMNPILSNGCNPIEPVPLDPNITMKIGRADGSTIKTIQTGTIGRSKTPVWIRYSVLFTMPDDGNTVVIKLVNNGSGGCGNDLVMDDIEFRPCHPLLEVNFDKSSASNLEVCENSSVLIKSNLGSGYDQPVYQWQESKDSLTWNNIENAITPSYLIKASFSEKRFYRLACTQFPNTLTDQNIHCKSVSNSLSITVIKASDCSVPRIHIPDSFTPNNDGVNDVLTVYFSEKVSFELYIFNRWGSVIFTTDANGPSWDGTYLDKPCMEGIYPWKIKYQSANSKTYTGDYFQTGQVVLVR